MSITCRECGSTAEEATTFCTSCGSYLEWTGERRAASTPDRQPGRAGERVTLEQRAGVEVSLSADQVEVTPGGSATVELAVHNSGTQVDEVRLEVSGPVAGWSQVVPEVVNLYPDQSGRAELRLSPPLGRDVLAGQVSYEVRAASSNGPVAGRASGSVTVLADRGLEAVLEPRISRGNGRAVQRVRLTNTGNAAASVQVSGSDLEGTMRVDCAPSTALVPPYSAVAVEVVTRVPWRLVGPERTRQFEVVAVPERPLPRTTMPGQRTTTAVFRSWWPIVLLTLLALLIALALAVLPRLDSIRNRIEQQFGDQQQQQQQTDQNQPPAVTMPKVTGLEGDDVAQQLEANGFGVDISPEQHDAADVVTEQDPQEGAQLEPGQTITLTVEPPPGQGQ